MTDGISIYTKSGGFPEVGITYNENPGAMSVAVNKSPRTFWDLTTDENLKDVKKETFNGNDAFEATFVNKNISLEQSELYIYHNGHVYVLSFDSSYGDSGKKIFEEILSTFKFTDKYQTVDLKDVLKYSDSSKNIFIKTSGNIVILTYGNFGDRNIVLSNGNNNYILVTISHGDISNYSDTLSTLNKDDKIEVNGVVGFTSREVLFNATKIDAYKNLLSVNQNLPDRIGMITVTGTIQKLK